MKCEQITLTPELAEKLLAKNTHNRTIRPSLVAFYAAEMTRGEWQDNGETIKFGLDGALLDGQHRLLAVIQSGITIKTILIKDLDPTTFQTIDTGANRSSRDILSLAGEKNTNSLAPAARIIMSFPDYKSRFLGKSSRFSNTQILNFVREHPKLTDCVAFCDKGRRLFGSTGAAFYFLFSIQDADEAEVFFTDLIEGTGLKRTSSIYLLRERLLNQRGTRLCTQMKWALFIKAWNLRNERVLNLQWRESEDFPVIGTRRRPRNEHSTPNKFLPTRFMED